MRNRDNELDKILDEALRSYADASETVSSQLLITGVMESLQQYRRRRLWIFALTPALACLLLIAFLLPHSVQRVHNVKMATPAIHQDRPVQQTAVAAPLHAPTATHRRFRSVTTIHRLQKLEQFPSPHPLSKQEQLLADFVEHASPATALAIATQQQQPIQPLQISRLKIPPLDKSNSQ